MNDLPSESITFTVVIGTFNGARTLAAALDAIEAQITDYRFEILVVNDASTDGTSDIADRPNVRLITLERNQGHGNALNVGLAEARGQYLAMMDDDCVPPSQWVQELGNAWGRVALDVTVIGGVVEPYQMDTFNRRYVAYRRPLRHQEENVNEDAGVWRRLRNQFSPPSIPSEPSPVYYTVGANMSVRVTAAREVGGFASTPGPGEEESLALRLRARFGRKTIVLFPQIVMKHDFRPSLRDTYRRSHSYGRANGAEWIRDRDVPSLAPLPPFAIVVSGLVAIISPAVAIVAFLLSPYFLYRHWFRWRRESGLREVMLYPYIQAGEEMVGNVGFGQGALNEYRVRRASRHDPL